eukprot:PhM_4_TR1246/c1_g1_i1/m.28354
MSRTSSAASSLSRNAPMQSNSLLWGIVVVTMLCLLQAPTTTARLRSSFPAPNAHGKRQYLTAANFTKSVTWPEPLPVAVEKLHANDTNLDLRFVLPDGARFQMVYYMLFQGTAQSGLTVNPDAPNIKLLAHCWDEHKAKCNDHLATGGLSSEYTPYTAMMAKRGMVRAGVFRFDNSTVRPVLKLRNLISKMGYTLFLVNARVAFWGDRHYVNVYPNPLANMTRDTPVSRVEIFTTDTTKPRISNIERLYPYVVNTLVSRKMGVLVSASETATVYCVGVLPDMYRADSDISSVASRLPDTPMALQNGLLNKVMWAGSATVTPASTNYLQPETTSITQVTLSFLPNMYTEQMWKLDSVYNAEDLKVICEAVDTAGNHGPTVSTAATINDNVAPHWNTTFKIDVTPTSITFSGSLLDASEVYYYLIPVNMESASVARPVSFLDLKYKADTAATSNYMVGKASATTTDATTYLFEQPTASRKYNPTYVKFTVSNLLPGTQYRLMVWARDTPNSRIMSMLNNQPAPAVGPAPRFGDVITPEQSRETTFAVPAGASAVVWTQLGGARKSPFTSAFEAIVNTAKDTPSSKILRVLKFGRLNFDCYSGNDNLRACTSRWNVEFGTSGLSRLTSQGFDLRLRLSRPGKFSFYCRTMSHALLADSVAARQFGIGLSGTTGGWNTSSLKRVNLGFGGPRKEVGQFGNITYDYLSYKAGDYKTVRIKNLKPNTNYRCFGIVMDEHGRDLTKARNNTNATFGFRTPYADKTAPVITTGLYSANTTYADKILNFRLNKKGVGVFVMGPGPSTTLRTHADSYFVRNSYTCTAAVCGADNKPTFKAIPTSTYDLTNAIWGTSGAPKIDGHEMWNTGVGSYTALDDTGNNGWDGLLTKNQISFAGRRPGITAGLVLCDEVNENTGAFDCRLVAHNDGVTKTSTIFSQAPSVNGIHITGLEARTEYRMFFWAQDFEGNAVSTLSELNFNTTSYKEIAIDGFNVHKIRTSSAQMNISATRPARIYWAVIPSDLRPIALATYSSDSNMMETARDYIYRKAIAADARATKTAAYGTVDTSLADAGIYSFFRTPHDQNTPYTAALAHLDDGRPFRTITMNGLRQAQEYWVYAFARDIDPQINLQSSVHATRFNTSGPVPGRFQLAVNGRAYTDAPASNNFDVSESEFLGGLVVKVRIVRPDTGINDQIMSFVSAMQSTIQSSLATMIKSKSDPHGTVNEKGFTKHASTITAVTAVVSGTASGSLDANHELTITFPTLTGNSYDWYKTETICLGSMPSSWFANLATPLSDGAGANGLCFNIVPQKGSMTAAVQPLVEGAQATVIREHGIRIHRYKISYTLSFETWDYRALNYTRCGTTFPKACLTDASLQAMFTATSTNPVSAATCQAAIATIVQARYVMEPDVYHSTITFELRPKEGFYIAADCTLTFTPTSLVTISSLAATGASVTIAAATRQLAFQPLLNGNSLSVVSATHYEIDDTVLFAPRATDALGLQIRFDILAGATDERDYFTTTTVSTFASLLSSFTASTTSTVDPQSFASSAVATNVLKISNCAVVGVAVGKLQTGPKGNSSLLCNTTIDPLFALRSASQDVTWDISVALGSWFSSGIPLNKTGVYTLRVKKTAPTFRVYPTSVNESQVRAGVKVTMELFGDQWFSTFPGPMMGLRFVSDVAQAVNPYGWTASVYPGGIPAEAVFQAISIDGNIVAVDSTGKNLTFTLRSLTFDTRSLETLTVSILANATVSGVAPTTTHTLEIKPSSGTLTVTNMASVKETEFRSKGAKISLSLDMETFDTSLASLASCIQTSVMVVAPMNDVATNPGGFISKKSTMMPTDSAHFAVSSDKAILVTIDPLSQYNTAGDESIYFDMAQLSQCVSSKLTLSFTNTNGASSNSTRPQFLVSNDAGEVQWLYPQPFATKLTVVRLTEADIRTGATLRFTVVGDEWQPNLAWITPVMFSSTTQFSINASKITSTDGTQLEIKLNPVKDYDITETQNLNIIFSPSSMKSGFAPGPLLNGATTLIAKISALKAAITFSSSKPTKGGVTFGASVAFTQTGWTGGLDLNTDPAGSESAIAIAPTGIVYLRARTADNVSVEAFQPAASAQATGAQSVSFSDIYFTDDVLPAEYAVGCYVPEWSEFLTNDAVTAIKPDYKVELTYPTSIVNANSFEIDITVTHGGLPPRANVSAELIGSVNGTLFKYLTAGRALLQQLLAKNGTTGLQNMTVRITTKSGFVQDVNFTMAVQDATAPSYQISGTVAADVSFTLTLLNVAAGGSLKIVQKPAEGLPSCSSGTELVAATTISTTFPTVTIAKGSHTFPLDAVVCYNNALVSSGASFTVAGIPVDSVVVLTPLRAGYAGSVKVTPAKITGEMIRIYFSKIENTCDGSDANSLPLVDVSPLSSIDGTFNFNVSVSAGESKVFVCYSQGGITNFKQIPQSISVAGAPPVAITVSTMSTSVPFVVQVNDETSSVSQLGLFLDSSSTCEQASKTPDQIVTLEGGLNPVVGTNGAFTITIQKRVLGSVRFCFRWDASSPWRSTYLKSDSGVTTFSVQAAPSFSASTTMYPKTAMTLGLQLAGDVTSATRVFLTTKESCIVPVAADRKTTTAVFSGIQTDATLSGLQISGGSVKFFLAAADSFEVVATNIRVCVTMDVNNKAYSPLPNSAGGDVFSLIARPAVAAKISYSGLTPCTLEAAPTKKVPTLTVTMIDVNGDVASSATNTLTITAYNGTGTAQSLFGTTSVTLTAANLGKFVFDNVFLGAMENKTVYFNVSASGLSYDSQGRDRTCTGSVAIRGAVSATGSVFSSGSNVLPSTGAVSYIDVAISDDTFNVTAFTKDAAGAALVRLDSSGNPTSTTGILVVASVTPGATSTRITIDPAYRPAGQESWLLSIPGSLTTSKLAPLTHGNSRFTIIGRMGIVAAPATISERAVATGASTLLLTFTDAPNNLALVDGVAFTEAASALIAGITTDASTQVTSGSNWGSVSSKALPITNIIRRLSNQIEITFSPSAFSIISDDSFNIVVPPSMLSNYPYSLATSVTVTNSPALANISASVTPSVVKVGQPGGATITVVARDTAGAEYPLDTELSVSSDQALNAPSVYPMRNGRAVIGVYPKTLGTALIKIQTFDGQHSTSASVAVVPGEPASFLPVVAAPTAVGVNMSMSFSYKVVDSAGNALSNVSVELTTSDNSVARTNSSTNTEGVVSFGPFSSDEVTTTMYILRSGSAMGAVIAFSVSVSTKYMTVSGPSALTSTVGTDIPLNLFAHLGTESAAGTIVTVNIRRGAVSETPFQVTLNANGTGTGSFKPTITGTFTVQAIAAGLPIATTVVSVVGGAPKSLAFILKPSATTGYALSDTLAFTVRAFDAFGFQSTNAANRVNVTIRSGPAGGALRGADAAFLYVGSVYMPLSVTMLGTYTLSFCLDGVAQPTCLDATVNVLIPEVSLVAANSGRFSACTPISTTATYAGVSIDLLKIQWTVTNADGTAIPVPTGWTVGSAIPTGANRLGAQLAQAAADASNVYTATSTSFTFDTSVVAVTQDILVNLKITISGTSVTSSRVYSASLKASTVGNEISQVSISGADGSVDNANPGITLLNSQQPLTLSTTAEAPCGTTEYLWTCKHYASRGATSTPCTVFDAATNTVKPFASASASEFVIEAGSLPTLPAYIEVTVGARALGGTTYTTSSALQYAVESMPLLALMNVSSIPIGINQAVDVACASTTVPLSRDPADPPSVVDCTGCSFSWLLSNGNAADLTLLDSGRVARIISTSAAVRDLSCVVTKGTRTSHTNVTLTVLNQVVPKFAVKITQGSLIGHSPTQPLRLEPVFGGASSIGPLPAPYTSMTWSAVDQLGRTVRLQSPSGDLVASVTSDLVVPGTIPAGSLASDITSIAVTCTGTPSSGQPISVITNITVTQPPTFHATNVTLFYLASATATATQLTSASRLGTSSGYIRLVCEACFTPAPVDYRVTMYIDTVSENSDEVSIAGTDSTGALKGDDGAHFAADRQWTLMFDVPAEAMTMHLRVCGRIAGETGMVEICGLVSLPVTIVPTIGTETRLRTYLTRLQQYGWSWSFSSVARIIAMQRALRYWITRFPVYNTINARNLLLTSLEEVSNELVTRAAAIRYLSYRNVHRLFIIGMWSGRALQGVTEMTAKTASNMIAVIDAMLSSIATYRAYRWRSSFLRALVGSWSRVGALHMTRATISRPSTLRRALLTTTQQQSLLNQVNSLLDTLSQGVDVGASRSSTSTTSSLLVKREQAKNVNTFTFENYVFTKEASYPSSVTSDATGSVADIRIAVYSNSTDLRTGSDIADTAGSAVHVELRKVSGTFTTSTASVADFQVTTTKTSDLAAVIVDGVSVLPECYRWDATQGNYLKASVGVLSNAATPTTQQLQTCALKGTADTMNEFAWIPPHPLAKSKLSCETNVLPGERVACTITPLNNDGTAATIPSGRLQIKSSMSGFLNAQLPTSTPSNAPYTFYLTAPSTVGSTTVSALVGKQVIVGSPATVTVSSQGVSGSYFTCTKRSIQSTCNPIDNCITRSTMSMNCTIFVRDYLNQLSTACVEKTHCAGTTNHPGMFQITVRDTNGVDHTNDVVYNVNADQTVKTAMPLLGDMFNVGALDSQNRSAEIRFTVNGPMKGFTSPSVLVSIAVKGDASTAIKYQSGAGLLAAATIGVRDRIPDSTSALTCVRSYGPAGTWATGNGATVTLSVSSPGAAIAAFTSTTPALPTSAISAVNVTITCSIAPRDGSGFIAGLATDFEPNMAIADSTDTVGLGFFTSQATISGTSPSGCSCTIAQPDCTCTLAASSDRYTFSFTARPFYSGAVKNRLHQMNVLVNGEMTTSLSQKINLGYDDSVASATLTTVSDCTGSDGSSTTNTAVSGRAVKCTMYVIETSTNRLLALNPSCLSFTPSSGHFQSSFVTMTQKNDGYSFEYSPTVANFGSCGSNNQCTYTFTLQSSTCGTTITSPTRFVTVEHGVPTAASSVSCSGTGMYSSNVRVGSTATCRITARDNFGAITCCRGSGFSLSSGSLTPSSDNMQFTSTYTAPTSIPTGNGASTYGVTTISATLSSGGAPLSGSPVNLNVVDYPTQNSTVNCSTGTVSTMQTLTCYINLFKNGASPVATTGDPTDFVVTSSDARIASIGSIMPLSTSLTPLGRPNSVMVFTITASKKAGTGAFTARSRIAHTAPTTVVSSATALGDALYDLQGTKAITVSYGTPTTASSLACSTTANAVDALQKTPCVITVRDATGLTTSDPTAAAPFSASMLPNLSGESPVMTTDDEGASWKFNLTATQQYLLGTTLKIQAYMGNTNITSSPAGPYTVVGRPSSTHTTLSCSPAAVTTLMSTTCTITPRNAVGPTRATISTFQVVPGSGSVNSFVSNNDGATISFTFKSAATALSTSSQLRLNVLVNNAFEVGTTTTVSVTPGTPTTRTVLNCTSSKGDKIVEIGRAMVCTIYVADNNGPTAVSPSEFSLALEPAYQGTIPKTLQLTDTKTDGQTYTFPFTANVTSPSTVRIVATLTSSQATVSTDNQIVFGTPTSASTLMCAATALSSGQSTTCTITSRDALGATTAAAGTFAVSATNGQVSALTSNGNGATFTFTFTAGSSSAATVSVALGSATIASQAFTVQTTVAPTDAPKSFTGVIQVLNAALTAANGHRYNARSGITLTFATTPSDLTVSATWSVEGAVVSGVSTDSLLAIASQSNAASVKVSLTLRAAGYLDFSTTATLTASAGPTGGSITAAQVGTNWTLTCSGWSSDAVSYDYLQFNEGKSTVFRTSSSTSLDLGHLIRSLTTTVTESWGCVAHDSMSIASTVVTTNIVIPPYNVADTQRDAEADRILQAVPTVSATWNKEQAATFVASLSNAAASIKVLATTSAKVDAAVLDLSARLFATSSLTTLSDADKAALAPSMIATAVLLVNASATANSNTLKAVNNIIVPPLTVSTAQQILQLLASATPAAPTARRTNDDATVSQQVAAKAAHAVVAADSYAFGTSYTLSSASSPIAVTAIKNINSRLAAQFTFESATFSRPADTNTNRILVVVTGTVKPSRRSGAKSNSYLFGVATTSAFLEYSGSQYAVDMSAVSSATDVTVARWDSNSDAFAACGTTKSATCTSMSPVAGAPSEYALVSTATAGPTASVTPVPTPTPTVQVPSTPAPEDDSDSGLSSTDKAILGGVLGGVGGVILIAIVGFCIYKKRRPATPTGTSSEAVAEAQGQP